MYKTIGTHTPDALFVGDFPVVTRSVIVEDGAGALARGTVLGMKTSGGKYVLSLSASSDGSEVPQGILAEAITATGADVTTSMYLTGQFNEDRIVLGTGHSVASVRDALRAVSIFLSKAISR